MNEVARIPPGFHRTSELRREQIRNAARLVISRDGCSNATLRQIADAAGVSLTELTYHFPQKNELLSHLLDRWHAEDDATAIKLAVGDGLEYFIALPRLMRHHISLPGHLELLLALTADRAVSAQQPASARGHYDKLIASGMTHMRQAEEVGRIGPRSPVARETEVRLLIAVMDGLELQWRMDPSIDIVEHLTTFCHIAIHRWQTGETPVRS